jgi:hypothetical protein
MNKVITHGSQSGYKVYKWCVFDVLEKCPEWRVCDDCGRWDDCQGKARHPNGFYRIENPISEKPEVSRETRGSEMLCLMPSQEGLIYREFDLSIHVV